MFYLAKSISILVLYNSTIIMVLTLRRDTACEQLVRSQPTDKYDMKSSDNPYIGF